MSASVQPLTIDVGADERVSALLQRPASPRACYVMAHGAGAGMAHPFMARLASDLAERGVATLRFQFPYMERGSKRTDPPALAHATVRAAVCEAAKRLPELPLFAGGRSFGGRMSSQAQAIAPLANVRGLIFVGFPLHPAGKPAIERAVHLDDVRIPMLFLQGTNDELAELRLLEPVVERLGARASLALFDAADHAFHVPARSGRRDADVRAGIADAIASWIGATIERATERALGAMR